MKAKNSTAAETIDRHHMRAALTLARRGLGNVWPNPAVGCVLVRPDLDDRVVGRGWTQPGGRPHAETEALGRAGDAAKGATAYVTLEPCSHRGETGPCAEALIDGGVTRCVVAMEDPDPRVAGGGLKRLGDAGIDVELGLMRGEAERLNAGFVSRLTLDRPLVSLKVASTLDGHIATRTGASQWITGPMARQRGHLLRASHDAILTGIGTVLADDPALTCRLPGLGVRSPVRVVLDSHGRLPATAKLAATAAEQPTWCYGLQPAENVANPKGTEVHQVPASAEGRVDIDRVLSDLADRGVTRVLVEAGPEIVASVLRAGVVDRLFWFRAASVVGGDGRAAAAGMGVAELADMAKFRLESSFPVGDDTLEIYTSRAEA